MACLNLARPNSGQSARRLRPGSLIALGALASTLFSSGSAHADLTGLFAEGLDTDTGYVTGVNGATDIAWSGDRAVITTKNGTVWVRRADGTKNQLTGLFGTVDTEIEKGLLGVVADPATPNTFYFYVSNGTTDADKHRVLKGTLAENDTITIDAMPIIAASRNNGPGLEGPANHDGGGLVIYEGQLYVGVGDTGSNATPPTNKYGSCLNKPNGKILRVNLDGSVPADNPLSNETMVTSCETVRGAWGTAAPDKRIFAWGFRNPWRFWVDEHTGLFWIADVGELDAEEVSIGRGNEHYGYPFWEGRRDWSTGQPSVDLGKSCDEEFAPSRPCTPAVYDYDHSGANQSSIIGGLIPEGCGWTDALEGSLYYFFADFNRNFIKALEVEPDRSGIVSDTAVDVGTFQGGPASFRQGPDGGLYVVMNGAGAVYRFTPKVLMGEDCMDTGAGGTGGMGGMSGASGSAGSDAGTAGSAGGGAGGQNSGGMPGGGMSGSATSGGAGSGGSAGTATSGSGGAGGASAGTTSTTGGTGAASGTGGSGNVGGAMAGTAGTATGAGGSTGGDDAPADDGGCGCRIAGTGNGTLASAIALAGLAFAFARRGFRRRR
jgi:MYXO-CTERM domain-containing protein